MPGKAASTSGLAAEVPPLPQQPDLLQDSEGYSIGQFGPYDVEFRGS